MNPIQHNSVQSMRVLGAGNLHHLMLLRNFEKTHFLLVAVQPRMLLRGRASAGNMVDISG